MDSGESSRKTEWTEATTAAVAVTTTTATTTTRWVSQVERERGTGTCRYVTRRDDSPSVKRVGGVLWVSSMKMGNVNRGFVEEWGRPVRGDEGTHDLLEWT